MFQQSQARPLLKGYYPRRYVAPGGSCPRALMCGRAPAAAANFSLSFWFTSSRWRPFFRACLNDLLTFFTRSRSCLFRFSRVATFCCSFLTWSSSSNRAFCTDEHMSCGGKNAMGETGEVHKTSLEQFPWVLSSTQQHRL